MKISVKMVLESCSKAYNVAGFTWLATAIIWSLSAILHILNEDTSIVQVIVYSILILTSSFISAYYLKKAGVIYDEKEKTKKT